MAAGQARQVLKVPGRFVRDPSDLSAAYPYGGTEIGLAKEIELRYQVSRHVMTAEEWGEQVVDVIYGGTTVMIGCKLRGMDDEALDAVHYDTEVGSPSGDRIVNYRVTNGRAGTLAGTKGMVLLFVPDSPLRHRAIILRDALPMLAEDAVMNLTPMEELETAVVFWGRPDSDGEVAVFGYVKDLTL